MILISQWYEPSCEVRRHELLLAKTINESSGVFEKIHYVNGISRMWTYGDMFAIASREYRGKVCVVANTDIAFDGSAALIPVVCRPNMVVALTRWEDLGSPNMLGHLLKVNDLETENWFFSGTQDAWAFIPETLPAIGDVAMGNPGCEQVLMARLARSGCHVVSPSLDIRIMHMHATHSTYEGVPVSCGEYGYPRMATMRDMDGYVMIHQCPCKKCNNGNGDGNLSQEAIRTCPR